MGVRAPGPTAIPSTSWWEETSHSWKSSLQRDGKNNCPESMLGDEELNMNKQSHAKLALLQPICRILS